MSTSDQRRPRILVITSTFPARADDWRPAFVKDLAEMEAEAFDVTVLAPRTRDSQTKWPQLQVTRFPYFPQRYEGLADDAILPTLKSQRWRWIEAPLLVMAMTYWTVKLTRTTGPSVVHAHWILPGGLAAFVNHLINKTPYVVTVHGADIHAMRGRMPSTVKRMILRRAAAIVPVSADAGAVVRSLDASLELTTTEPVPMGVKPTDLTPSTRSTGSFLFVGRLAEKKGLDVAIRAVAATSGTHLHVIGDGPMGASARKMVAELGLHERISFLGRCERTEVLRQMASVSALVIPSIRASDGDQEGTPVVMAEAMSLGTPVIAARVGGLEDYIRDGVTGFLFDAGDVEQLASLMKLCQVDPGVATQVGAAGRAYFIDSPLNIEWTGQRYRGLLNDVMVVG